MEVYRLNSHTRNWEGIMRQRLWLVASVSAGKHVNKSTSLKGRFSTQTLPLWVLGGRVQGICAVPATLLKVLSPWSQQWRQLHPKSWSSNLEWTATTFRLQFRSVLHCYFNTLKLSTLLTICKHLSQLSPFLHKNIYSNYCYLQLNPNS